MHLDIKVAKIDGKNQTVKIYDIDRVPLSLKDPTYKDICDWLKSRSMNIYRNSARELSDIFHEPIGQMVLKMHGVSLTDCYWFKGLRDKTEWNDVDFRTVGYKNELSGFILQGTKPDSFCSPDMTTNGRLEKTWLYENGKEFLLKEIEEDTPLSGELLSLKLSKAFPALKFVEYNEVRLNEKSYTVCENFLKDNEEFISAYEVYNLTEKPFYESEYEHLLQNCRTLKIPDVRPFLQSMIAFDHIIGNTDRHFGNFGFIRNADTLEFTGPAPLFDNEMSFGEEIEVAKPFGNNQFSFLYKDTKYINIQELKTGIIDVLRELHARRFNENTIKAFNERVKIFDKVHEAHIGDKGRHQYISEEIERETEL